MKKRKAKGSYVLLCALMATIVVMSLVVLPHADSEISDPSVSDSQNIESEAPVSGEEIVADPEASASTDPEASASTDPEASASTDPEASASTDPEASASTDPEASASTDPEASASADPDEIVSPSPTESVSPSPTESVTPSPSESPTRTDFIFENDDVLVTVVLSEAGAVPDNAELYVVPITQENDSTEYGKVEAKVNENVEADNQTVTGFLAYDIYFMADGTEYEPELGTATVTIQYKNQPFDDATEEATDEIKVLHLEETDAGVQVTDVTQAVDLLNTGFVATPEATEEVSAEADSELSAGNSVKFVTESFSTFVVTGVSGTAKSMNVSLKFYETDGTTLANVSGTYYLYVSCSNYGGDVNNLYRNTVRLTVSGGTASATISGLYDQNGNRKTSTSLYPLINSSSTNVYTAVLFKNNGTIVTVTPGGSFSWDELNYKAKNLVKYELNSDIDDGYTVTGFSGAGADGVVNVSTTTGKVLAISATKKTGPAAGNGYLLSTLSPVLPYGVFATQFDLVGDMEGCIAVSKANLYSGNFGNTSNTSSGGVSLFCATTYKVVTIHKTYYGSITKTFTFGLFDSCGNLLDTAQITLPTESGGQTGTVSFSNLDASTCYYVYELGASNAKLSVGDSYNGFTLTSMSSSSSYSSSSNGNVSYINTILSCGNPEVMRGSSSIPNRLAVGSAYTVTSDTSRKYVKSGSTTILYIPKTNGDIVKAGGSYPMPDFAGILSNLAGLSANLAQMVSSDTVMVKNMTIAELNSKTNYELNFNTNGKMFVLNIDASASPSSISLGASAPFVVNGVSCGGYTAQANNVVINVYTKSGSTYSAYTGNITNAGFVFGTLLAPCARVTSLSQDFNGTVVGAYVTNVGGEIHHGGYTDYAIDETVYEFVNTAVLAIILPETGGIGTYIFYGVGGGIVLLAVVLMIIYVKHGKQKKRNRKRGRNRPSE